MTIPLHIQKLAKERSLEVTVRIGKSGLSDNILTEIRDQLNARELVKVKMNRGLFERAERDEIWELIAEKCNVILVFARGNVAVFYQS